MVETQNSYVPSGKNMAIYQGTFYSATAAEIQSGNLPEGVESSDNARGSNLITIVIHEFRDKVLDLDDEPIYRSCNHRSLTTYGSTIRDHAHTYATIPTSPKLPTGNFVTFKVQLSNASTSILDQELRNHVFKLGEEMDARISGAKSERLSADKADDLLIEEIINRKRARETELAKTIETLRVEYAIKERNARAQKQATEIDAALD